MDILNEGKTFRRISDIRRYTLKDLAEFLYAYLLGLQILRSSFDTVKNAERIADKDYSAIISINSFRSISDLATVMHVLSEPSYGCKMKHPDRNEIMYERIRFRPSVVTDWISRIEEIPNPVKDYSFFKRLERDLLIEDPKLKAAAVLASSWIDNNSYQRRLVLDEIIRILKRYGSNNDVLRELEKIRRNYGYDTEVEREHIADRIRKFGKSSLMSSILGKYLYNRYGRML